MTFFAGNLFPLDILPKPLYTISQLLPFQYMLYFPIKLYLGQLTLQEICIGFFIAFLWTILFAKIVNVVWEKGLISYGAYGQ
jgi:ABC-2 type transport system permease protein